MLVLTTSQAEFYPYNYIEKELCQPLRERVVRKLLTNSSIRPIACTLIKSLTFVVGESQEKSRRCRFPTFIYKVLTDQTMQTFKSKHIALRFNWGNFCPIIDIRGIKFTLTLRQLHRRSGLRAWAALFLPNFISVYIENLYPQEN